MKPDKILRTVNNFVIFFLTVSFVVSCCTMLFVSVMRSAMGLVLTADNIAAAAKITLLNVVLITIIFVICDWARRKITVDRPAEKIIDAGRRITEGDFSVRIPRHRSLSSSDPFGEIAECFNKMAEELSSIETLRSDFVANVSHELKTPLAVMQSYGALLSETGLDEKKRIEYAGGIKDAASHLSSLITNILRLNKLENQQIAPVSKKYDLSEQLAQCMLGFEDAWEKKGLDIEAEIEDGIYISSDAEMMSLVWNNLFSNAIKFTDNGKISLSAKRDGNMAVVKISDTGCGISAEVGKRIFDKFYQGDTSRATRGNGLGLALVKRIIDITGCDISVYSEVSVGTTFTVKIKRCTDED